VYGKLQAPYHSDRDRGRSPEGVTKFFSDRLKGNFFFKNLLKSNARQPKSTGFPWTAFGREGGNNTGVSIENDLVPKGGGGGKKGSERGGGGGGRTLRRTLRCVCFVAFALNKLSPPINSPLQYPLLWCARASEVSLDGVSAKE
jgi:hypothetical protein